MQYPNAKRLEIKQALGQIYNALIRRINPTGICMFGCLLLTANASHALVITKFNFYTSDTLFAIGSGGGFDTSTALNNYSSFDASLGTLEDINIKISGNVNVFGTSGQNIFTLSNGGLSVVPYTIDTTFSLNIDGMGAEFFDFNGPMETYSTFNASGAGESVNSFNGYSFSFDYNEFLTAFVGPTCASCTRLLPPIGISGNLDSFISDNILFDQLLFTYDFSFLESERIISLPTNISAVITTSIETTYTYSEPITESVPEPPVVLLLCSGFILLALRKVIAR